jgi:hypothetical protein
VASSEYTSVWIAVIILDRSATAASTWSAHMTDLRRPARGLLRGGADGQAALLRAAATVVADRGYAALTLDVVALARVARPAGRATLSSV